MTVLDKPQVKPAVPPGDLDDPLVPEPLGTVVVFRSKSLRYRAIRQPKVEEQGPTGAKRVVLSPVRYEFGPDGRCAVNVGNDILRDGDYDPESGDYKPLDAVGWLRRHPDLNGLFWEEGREPGRPQPIETEFLKLANEAFMDRDPERLSALLVQERETHGREVLLRTVEDQLVRLGAEVPPGEVNPQPVAPPPKTAEELEAEQRALAAGAMAGESRKGEGGIPLDKVTPYSGGGRGIF